MKNTGINLMNADNPKTYNLYSFLLAKCNWLQEISGSDVISDGRIPSPQWKNQIQVSLQEEGSKILLFKSWPSDWTHLLKFSVGIRYKFRHEPRTGHDATVTEYFFGKKKKNTNK